MKVHFVAIGGSAMHNLALALHSKGLEVSGSDDEVYEPSRSRLDRAGLLQKKMGWDADRITKDIDAVILGMHARIDNPELLKAQELGLPIYSYPEYVAKESEDKKRVVIAGSHGKTTTTSIVMNALDHAGIEFDYLVGAQLEGYDRMVKLSDADLIILEGDEYLSSPIDRRPKMLHYKPHLAVITGIAWDHINVFPTFEDYVKQFDLFLESVMEEGKVFYYEHDKELAKLAEKDFQDLTLAPYDRIAVDNGNTLVDGDSYPIQLIGQHNFQNIKAAELICSELGISKQDFYASLATFKGAAKRLQHIKVSDSDVGHVYLDFAHAPSKVKATVDAVKESYGKNKLVAVLELHTFSSLNKKFLPTYDKALDKADEAVVFYDEHTLKMKRMEPIDKSFVKHCFGRSDLRVITDAEELEAYMNQVDLSNSNLLLMSSGKFGGIDLLF